MNVKLGTAYPRYYISSQKTHRISVPTSTWVDVDVIRDTMNLDLPASILVDVHTIRLDHHGTLTPLYKYVSTSRRQEESFYNVTLRRMGDGWSFYESFLPMKAEMFQDDDQTQRYIACMMKPTTRTIYKIQSKSFTSKGYEQELYKTT